MKSEICFASCQNFSKLISPLGSLLEQPSFRKYKSFTNKLKNGMMIWKEINKIKGHSLTKSCFPYINSIISKVCYFCWTSPFLVCCLLLHLRTATWLPWDRNDISQSYWWGPSDVPKFQTWQYLPVTTGNKDQVIITSSTSLKL